LQYRIKAKADPCGTNNPTAATGIEAPNKPSRQTEQGRNPVTSRKTKSKRVNTSRQTKFAGSFYCVMETGLPHLLHEDRNRTGTEARAGIAAVEKNGGRAWAHRSMVTEQAAWLR
jgi:hypothetical protein